MEIKIDWAKLDWDEIEKFFYSAMLVSGYAAEKPNIQEWDHGFRRVVHREGKLRFEDLWTHTSNSPYSAGMTTIFYEVGGELAPVYVPIWVMHYSGFYHSKTARHCLKRILRDAYQYPETSLGCRGPRKIELDGHRYDNRAEMSSLGFRYFSGFEELWNMGANQLAGRHFYRATSLTG